MNQSPFSTANFYPAPGEILDSKYAVEHILGEGGMGAVAKATHLLRRAPVALKFMSPAVVSIPGAVERFINEGVAASQIDSDHVVKIFDVGRLPSSAPYLVMEFLEGRDLAAVLEHEGRPGLEIPRAVHFVLQALRGLQVAHAAGIVHRDMKPSNCFVITKDGEPDFVKLVDFGISKVNQEGGQKITKTNSALGTPVYMSPEQAKSPRDVDLRSDLYSVGVVLYELLCGRTPFTSETGEFTEILFKIFTEEPPPLQRFVNVPDGLAAAVHKALVRDLSVRYASAAEMGEALAPWADARSQHVLQRLRGFEVARASRVSAFPPPGVGVPHVGFHPASQEARVTAADAMARTQAGDTPPYAPPGRAMPVSIPPPAAVPRTDIGVTKDTTLAGTKRRTGTWAGVAFGAIAISAAAFGVWRGRSVEPPPKATAVAPVEVAPPPVELPKPSPVVSLEREAPTATPSAAPPPPQPSAPRVEQAAPKPPRPPTEQRAAPTPAPTALPKSLSEVGFH